MWNRARSFAVAVVLLTAAPVAAQAEWTSFTFSKVNTVYNRTDTDVAWSSGGSIGIEMASPNHRLELLENQVELRPLGDGLYDSITRVRFRGEGDIKAKVDALGSVGDFSDHLVIPEQEVEVAGTLRLVPREGDEVEVVAVDLPAVVTVEIESGLGRQLYTICNLTLAILVGADCRLIEAAFTTVPVPLPEAGTATVLTSEHMSSVEAVRLHAWVTATRDAVVPSRE